MKNRSLVLALAGAAVCLITGIVYFATSSGEHPEVIAVASTPAPVLFAAREGKMEAVTTPPKTFQGRLSPEADSIDAFSSNPKRDSEEQMILDLAADRKLTDQAKVQRMLDMIPTLPPDAQTLAVENATALIQDGEYLNYRGRLLQLANTPDMRVAVLHDSLTRGEEVRLPNLLEMMRTSTSEEEKLEIREIFEAYLDKDYGPNPADWEAPLRKWVAEVTES